MIYQSSDNLLQTPLSVRAVNCCREWGATTIGQLAELFQLHTESVWFTKSRNCGIKTYEEISSFVSEYLQQAITRLTLEDFSTDELLHELKRRCKH